MKKSEDFLYANVLFSIIMIIDKNEMINMRIPEVLSIVSRP